MYRLFSISLVLVVVVADPRTPKIYNVLISSKKNLSPSQALPVYEPVLRTTSLGVALPPLFYHTPVAYVGQNQPGVYQPQPAPFEPAKPSEAVAVNAPPSNVNDPKNVIANLKRNPNIPDVPPPALPTRIKS